MDLLSFNHMSAAGWRVGMQTDRSDLALGRRSGLYDAQRPFVAGRFGLA